MKPLIRAKQLTLHYFSVVAIAIILIHLSVFVLTTNDLEYGFAQNRLDKLYEVAKPEWSYLESSIEAANSDFTVPNFVRGGVSGSIIFDTQSLPSDFPVLSDLNYGEAFEVERDQSVNDLYIMKVPFSGNNKTAALLVIDNALYDLSEQQLFYVHSKQIVISVVLTLLSLFVVIKISDKLTQPLATFSRTLSNRKPNELDQIPLPEGAVTKELEEMVSVFNRYQSQIKELLERERAFNRYASHELRSPLMVINGASILLSESSDPEFSKRQHLRIRQACDEMSEFVETLLSLTKSDERTLANALNVSGDLVNSIVENHNYMIEKKDVECKVKITNSISINMPESAFRILLGNLLKNAFAYTEEGHVTIKVTGAGIFVEDSGKGYEPNTKEVDGFGLGLLLVSDICHRFGYKFELIKNSDTGSTASIKKVS